MTICAYRVKKMCSLQLLTGWRRMKMVAHPSFVIYCRTFGWSTQVSSFCKTWNKIPLLQIVRDVYKLFKGPRKRPKAQKPIEWRAFDRAEQLDDFQHSSISEIAPRGYEDEDVRTALLHKFLESQAFEDVRRELMHKFLGVSSSDVHAWKRRWVGGNDQAKLHAGARGRMASQTWGSVITGGGWAYRIKMVRQTCG